MDSQRYISVGNEEYTCLSVCVSVADGVALGAAVASSQVSVQVIVFFAVILHKVRLL